METTGTIELSISPELMPLCLHICIYLRMHIIWRPLYFEIRMEQFEIFLANEPQTHALMMGTQ